MFGARTCLLTRQHPCTSNRTPRAETLTAKNNFLTGVQLVGSLAIAAVFLSRIVIVHVNNSEKQTNCHRLLSALLGLWTWPDRGYETNTSLLLLLPSTLYSISCISLRRLNPEPCPSAGPAQWSFSRRGCSYCTAKITAVGDDMHGHRVSIEDCGLAI